LFHLHLALRHFLIRLPQVCLCLKKYFLTFKYLMIEISKISAR
jgi:hypothetical protein